MRIDLIRSELDSVHKQLYNGVGGSTASFCEAESMRLSLLLDELQDEPIRVTPKSKYRCTVPYRKLLAKQTAGKKKEKRIERACKDPRYPA